jgi:hypothetical protein
MTVLASNVTDLPMLVSLTLVIATDSGSFLKKERRAVLYLLWSHYHPLCDPHSPTQGNFPTILAFIAATLTLLSQPRHFSNQVKAYKARSPPKWRCLLFGDFVKTVKTFVVSVFLSVRTEISDHIARIFMKFDMNIICISVEKMQVLLISHKNIE